MTSSWRTPALERYPFAGSNQVKNPIKLRFYFRGIDQYFIEISVVEFTDRLSITFSPEVMGITKYRPTININLDRFQWRLL